jgi:uncharacterized protein
MPQLRHPRPQPTPLDTPYWDGLAEGMLRIQKCAECGTYQWYPRPLCSNCYSEQLEWEPVATAGTLYSYTVTHQRTGFAFDESLPFVVAVVDITEAPGVRLTGLLRDIPGDPKPGMPVRGIIKTIEAGDSTYGVLEFVPA